MSTSNILKIPSIFLKNKIDNEKKLNENNNKNNDDKDEYNIKVSSIVQDPIDKYLISKPETK